MDLARWVIIFYLSVAVIVMAVFIWLTVRVINRRERWAKWSLVAMSSMPVLYLASWAPMRCVSVWLDNHGLYPDWLGRSDSSSVLAIVYYPASLTVNSDAAPGWLRDGMIWYLGIWGGP